jgi:hypothetical protein
MSNNDKKLQAVLPAFQDIPAVLAIILQKLDHLAFLTNAAPLEPEKPMRIKECADFLTELEGKPVATQAVYNRVHRGTLPCRRSGGGTLFFYRKEILEAINSMNTTPLIIEQVA